MTSRVATLVLCASAGAQALLAQGAPRPIVRLIPDAPRQGSIVQLVVSPDSGGTFDRVRGSLAGQPLHFERERSGVFHALAGVPVSAPATLPLVIFAHSGEDSTYQLVRIPVTHADFAVERLRVAPRFAERPDSAVAARIALDRARSHAVARHSLGERRLWSGAFDRPATGRVTSTFGEGREFNGILQSRHLGTDFAGTVGTPVTAPNRGVVAMVDTTFYGGLSLYLDHGAGITTTYLHLSAALVQPGDTVEMGQVIARIGASGRVTGPHLHWIARYGTVVVDPLSLAEADLPAFGAPPTIAGDSAAGSAPAP